MGCCGGKKNFKSKVVEAQKRKMAAKRELQPPKTLLEKTTVDGVPFATVPDNQLQPKQLRMKIRAIRVKSRNERLAQKNRQNKRLKTRSIRDAKRKAQEAKLKNNQ